MSTNRPTENSKETPPETLEEWEERFRELEQFLRTYFDQDWMDEWDTAEEGVAQYIEDTLARKPEELPAVVDQIHRLLAFGLSEEELDHVVSYLLGSNYYTKADGLTDEEWLSQVADELEAAYRRHLGLRE